MLTTSIFWLSITLLAHVYLLFPLPLRAIAAALGTAKQPQAKENLPFASIIISAYNEEKIIEEKIKNTIALNYPKNKIEILIGDDGSNDKTAEIAAKYSEARIFKNEKNEGKASMLNKLRAAAKGEILVFSDANTMLKKDALEKLAKEFSNEKVGCACGQLQLKAENFDLSKTESTYWKRETRLKALESRFGTVMGSNGALYAIRSSLYTELPVHKTVMDDFYITAKILMQNHACVFCESALAIENASASKRGEFKRKVRIGRANFNFLFDYLPLLNPLHPIKAYIFFSHKLLRWLGSFLLIAVFLCSILLMQSHIFYKAFFAAEMLFLVLALLGVRVFKYFLSMNFALLLGFCKAFAREKGGSWERVGR